MNKNGLKVSIKLHQPGLVHYQEAWDFQKSLFEEILNQKKSNITPEMHLISLEHPHVYTLGKNGDPGNALFNDVLLKKIEAELYHIERGGDITYHGYGQLVGYPILDLEQLNLGIKGYINLLESALINTVAEYGIVATQATDAIGVWIDAGKPSARKIAAIGVKSSRYVTMHGFALNVTTDLNYFNYINPCGFVDRGVTSIEKETGLRPTLDEVSALFIKHFSELTNCEVR